ncbi:hypothetical protein M23134_01433 [Microscilla marina ATCC 23134]|uniref:Uncharacterized protein n=1 Tax=Microscilla marina ATCC 23134 TaxID=313606 RepID=A1ZJS4_MICM2|nr:hypothetical protein M23134_01433 [Microscilla marina ATCC 23134]
MHTYQCAPLVVAFSPAWQVFENLPGKISAFFYHSMQT